MQGINPLALPSHTEILPWKMDWAKIQQCKRKPDEPVLDFFECFKKKLQIILEFVSSFKDYQNDPLLGVPVKVAE